MNTKITLPQLVEALSQLTGCSETVSETFIKELFILITDTLSREDTICIKNIGTFSRSESQSNPVQFVPCKEIADAINTPFAFFEPVELEDDISEIELNEELVKDNFDGDLPNNAHESLKECESAEETNVDICNNQDSPTKTLEEEEHESIGSQDEIVDVQEDLIMDNSIGDKYVEDAVEKSAEYVSKPSNKCHFIYGIISGIFIGFILGCICHNIYLNNMGGNDVTIKSEKNLVEDTITTKKDITTNRDSIVNISPTPKTKEIYDTIRTNRYLTTMARQYYGEMNFWVYIYEENKDHIKNPDKIKPGTPIRIPDAEKYNINAKDSASIEQAKLKAIEIYRQYR